MQKMLDGENNAFSFAVKHKRKNKVSDEMRTEIIEWVRNHDMIRTSPNYNDTLLINGVRVPKELREVSLNEIHKDLAESDIAGILDEKATIVLGYDSFKALLEEMYPNLRKATTKHMETCGCETCITMANMHITLNQYQKKILKYLKNEWNKFEKQFNNAQNIPALLKYSLENSLNSRKSIHDAYSHHAFPNQQAKHVKPSDALSDTMCQPVTINGTETYHWNCILGRCDICSNKEDFVKSRNE